MKIASRWGGCLLPLRFRTVSAAGAQTYLNCYRITSEGNCQEKFNIDKPTDILHNINNNDYYYYIRNHCL